MGEIKPLYKDPSINNRNKSDYDKNLKYWADLVRNAEKDENEIPLLKEILLDGTEKTDKKHHPSRLGCSGVNIEGDKKPEESENDPNRVTEKRICMCMYYYNRDWKKKKICDKCKLKKKWNNTGKIKINDYEVPMEYVITEIGCIDLLIDGKYAAEVKPEKSDSPETLVRMIAETLTYTAAIEKDYKPAICFFENSQQMDDFKLYMKEENEDLKYLMKYVSVFYILYRQNKEKNDVVDFEIKPINEYEGIYGN